MSTRSALRGPVKVCAVLALCAGAAHAAGDRDRNEPAHADAAGARAKSALRVSGRIRGRLYPGVQRRLVVRVTNRRVRPVAVTRVRARVRRAPRGCPRRALRVRPFRGRVRVRARGTRKVRLMVRMRGNAPNACQAAVFVLRLHASGSP